MYYDNLALEKFYLHGSVQKATYYQFLKVEFRDLFLPYCGIDPFFRVLISILHCLPSPVGLQSHFLRFPLSKIP